MRVNAELGSYARYVELRFFEERDGRFFAAKKIEVCDVGDGAYIEPSALLNKTEAQELMDALWQCGLRPSEGSGSAGALAATQRHLEDMRTLVFKTGKPK